MESVTALNISTTENTPFKYRLVPIFQTATSSGDKTINYLTKSNRILCQRGGLLKYNINVTIQNKAAVPNRISVVVARGSPPILTPNKSSIFKRIVSSVLSANEVQDFSFYGWFTGVPANTIFSIVLFAEDDASLSVAEGKTNSATFSLASMLYET